MRHLVILWEILLLLFSNGNEGASITSCLYCESGVTFDCFIPVSSSVCRTMEFLPCQNNTSLISHLITSITIADNPDLCQIKCYASHLCLSYNVGPAGPQGYRVCELNYGDHVAYGTSLAVRHGYQYCGMLNPCLSNPCPSGHACRPVYIAPVETYKCFTTGCQKAVGLESGEIPDTAMSASSQYSVAWHPKYGRLRTGHRCWLARHFNTNQWLQVDLGAVWNITKVATQGRPNHPHYVKSYTLIYSMDTKEWHEYKQAGLVKIFSGNFDKNSVVSHDLTDVITCLYIRIAPKTWHAHIALRAEFYGCRA